MFQIESTNSTCRGLMDNHQYLSHPTDRLFSSSEIVKNTADGTCVSESLTDSLPILYTCCVMLGGTGAGFLENCIPGERVEWYSTGLICMPTRMIMSARKNQIHPQLSSPTTKTIGKLQCFCIILKPTYISPQMSRHEALRQEMNEILASRRALRALTAS